MQQRSAQFRSRTPECRRRTCFFPSFIDRQKAPVKGLFPQSGSAEERAMANPLYRKHIISINDLNRDELELVLHTAAQLKAHPQPELLKHNVIASCFFEASTRTRLSFETAMHRLGASVVGFADGSNTSLGERGNPRRYHLGDWHLCGCHRDAPSAGRGGAAGHGVFGRRADPNAGDGANQHRRRRCSICSPSGKPRAASITSTWRWSAT